MGVVDPDGHRPAARSLIKRSERTSMDNEPRLAESRRRSWIFAIGAPYLIMIPLLIWGLAYAHLPLWLNRALFLLAVCCVAAYLAVGLGWVAKLIRAGKRP